MLTKVISGGQNGVDQAGLEAARIVGIATGGTMPKGHLTLDGPRPKLAAYYGLVEHESCSGYPPRTERNVMDSDGTIRLYYDQWSAGEKCTLRFIKKHKKPFFDVNLMTPKPVEEVVEWLKANDIKTLNVAGNSLLKFPSVFVDACQYLIKVFTLVKAEP